MKTITLIDDPEKLVAANEALKRERDAIRAVVDAARQRVENCHKCDNGIVGSYVGLDEADMPELVPQECSDCADLRVPLAAYDKETGGEH